MSETKRKSKKKPPEIKIPSVKELTARVDALAEATIDDLLASDIPFEVELKSQNKKVSIVIPKYEDYAQAGRQSGDDNYKSNLLLISFCLKKPKMTWQQLKSLKAEVAMELITIFNKLSGIDEESLAATQNLPKGKDSSSGE